MEVLVVILFHVIPTVVFALVTAVISRKFLLLEDFTPKVIQRI
jgi:hypothetical protein